MAAVNPMRYGVSGSMSLAGNLGSKEPSSRIYAKSSVPEDSFGKGFGFMLPKAPSSEALVVLAITKMLGSAPPTTLPVLPILFSQIPQF